MNNESSASSIQGKDDPANKYQDVLSCIKAFKQSRKAREEELQNLGNMKNAFKNMGYDSAREHIAAMVDVIH